MGEYDMRIIRMDSTVRNLGRPRMHQNELIEGWSSKVLFNIL